MSAHVGSERIAAANYGGVKRSRGERPPMACDLFVAGATKGCMRSEAHVSALPSTEAVFNESHKGVVGSAPV